MGAARTLLAICLVISHSGSILGWRPLDGGGAVILFFVVSGFYMSLVLNTKYCGFAGANLTFWRSRVMRLRPSYLVALLAAALLRRDIVLAIIGELDALSVVTVGVMNIFIFGSEWSQVLGIDTAGALIFSAAGATNNVGAYILLGQNWALGLELLFYLIAPFVVTSAPRVALLTLLAVACAIAVALSGLPDTWRYRFFPAVLVFFMAGACAYHLGEALRRHIPRSRPMTWLATAGTVLVLFTIAFPGTGLWFLPERHHVKALALLLVLALPLWLHWSKKIDGIPCLATCPIRFT